MADIIRIENLCKSYGEVKAVDDLTFKVNDYFGYVWNA